MKWLPLILILLLPIAVLAEQPHWSMELKGGQFRPAIGDWARYYGHDKTSEYGIALGYKWRRQWELGLGIDYARDTGQGLAPLSNTLAGQVDYQLYPLHADLLWRGVFDEDQWLVPYLGAGPSLVLYRQAIQGQSTITGKAGGWQARGGLQLLLDRLDPKSASAMADLLGVDNSYLILEAATSRVRKAGVDLGGTHYRLGLLFEF